MPFLRFSAFLVAFKRTCHYFSIGNNYDSIDHLCTCRLRSMDCVELDTPDIYNLLMLHTVDAS